MIARLLVANRGEIARRIFRTCRDLGIGTVAVFADADLAHVKEADVAARIPGYLDAAAIVAAALTAGADAVHPGYGFLAENADLARRVLAAGLTWVGPPPEAIEAMGSKIAAKKLMTAAGVPVLTVADPVTFPVLVKASAGGGGRGMRIVHTAADLPAAIRAAEEEAASAFGDPTVFCEPYVATGRHIEVQILADAHGTVWTLGERDCSVQRRHQKVIEETPSPFVGEDLRSRLGAAAVRAVTILSYRGAGTVEFLVEPSGVFHFLEVNTRLQVEHPVTECVRGLDLVALQLRIAEGARLDPEPPPVTGHAIEARLYAEDPALGWRPQAGTLHRFDVPGVDAEFAVPAGYGLRLDSAGLTDVGIHYDPMLAKLIAWAPTRAEAARRLAAALAGARIHGPTTNRDLLVAVLRDPGFLAGTADTSFLTHFTPPPPPDPALSALAAAYALAAGNQAAAPVLGGLPAGWRNVRSAPVVKRFAEQTVQWPAPGVEVLEATPTRVTLETGGLRRTFDVAVYPGLVCVDSPLGAVALHPVDRLPAPSREPAPGALLAPMPGAVTAVLVAEGDTVAAGQELLILEAMKMRYPIVAASAGVVRSLPVPIGAQVDSGALLAVVEE